MIKMEPVKYENIILTGGWDTQSPTLSLPAGVVKDALNFECALTGGYTRIAGYERYSGQTKPSIATYTIVQVTSFTNTPAAGNTLTGGTSGATGTVIAVGANYIALTKVTGSYVSAETVSVGATPIGTVTDTTVMLTSLEDAQYTNLAADVYRSDISPITGSGPIRGVFLLNDIVYAFRDNAGGTAVNMWKSSSSGWTAVTLYNEVSFTVGNGTEPADGATLTQGGVTATIKRTCTQSGAWGGTAAGRFIVTNPSGGNFAAGAATIGGTTCTLSGAQTAITLTPGGKFEFFQGNLYGSTQTIRMYGADGVNRGIEFDGTVLVPIATGATNDKPTHVVVHKNHLIWGIRSSIIHSAIGLPYNYTTTAGAGEIALGDTITGLLIQPGAQTTAALAILCRNTIALLYGTGSTSWNLVTYNQGTGAIDYSCQNMSESYFLDDRGVVSLATSLNYGNFAHATLTNNIKSYIVEKRQRVACSAINREKGQYRLFFNDGFGLYVTIANGKLIGNMPIYTNDVMYSSFSGETSDGAEVAFCGAYSSGHVYQMDVGTSFDGASIDASLTLNWSFAGGARIRKRFRKASIEMQGNYYSNISLGYSVSYGTTFVEQPTPKSYDSNFSGAPRWDSFTWDSFTWDGVTLSPSECEIVGTAENIQFAITSSTDYIAPFTVNSIIYHYTPRRGMR